MKKINVSEDTNVKKIDAPTTKESGKKLTIIGLPKMAKTKTGYGGIAERPGFKSKSSSATGAKKRVRQ